MRVLLVDDEPRYRDYLSAVFNDRGLMNSHFCHRAPR